MKFQQIYEPQSGKLVCQLIVGIYFAYNLYLVCLGDSWKGLTKEPNSEKGIHHEFGYSFP